MKNSLMVSVNNEAGSAALLGIFIVVISSIMATALWTVGDTEARLVEKRIQEESLMIAAEWGAAQEYEKMQKSSDLVQRLIRNGSEYMRSDSSSEYNGIDFEVYIGKRGEQIIIWSVAEHGDYKAQRGYCVNYDDKTGECSLEGMF